MIAGIDSESLDSSDGAVSGVHWLVAAELDLARGDPVFGDARLPNRSPAHCAHAAHAHAAHGRRGSKASHPASAGHSAVSRDRALLIFRVAVLSRCEQEVCVLSVLQPLELSSGASQLNL